MVIGLPRALLYYRFGILWETFFRELGCEVVTSAETSRGILESGCALAPSECCLPVKIYMGHVKSLVGRCDRVLVPRVADFGRNEELCVCFLGLADVVRSILPGVSLIFYEHAENKGRSQRDGFLRMGASLGKSRTSNARAYSAAMLEQERHDCGLRKAQEGLLGAAAPRVLISAQPYLAHDAYMGRPVAEMLASEGYSPVFSDRCDRAACRERSREISKTLYWTMNKEAVGAIPLCAGRVDGVVLLTAFPCGAGCLTDELVMRKIHGVPVTRLVLDEHQGEAGLRTRVESFADILRGARKS